MSSKKLKLLISAILLLSFVSSQKIGIVGTGIGGASFAHYLNKEYENVDFTFFERNQKMGGRTNTLKLTYKEKTYLQEMGAHFVIDDNLNVKDLVKELGLNLVDEQQKTFGIFSQKEKEMKFLSSIYEPLTILKMFYRYGYKLASFMYSQAKELKQFMNIYDFQIAKGQDFGNYEEFLKITKQYENFNQTASDCYSKNLRAPELFKNEVLESFISYFYNQNSDVNGYTGMVTAAGLQGKPKEIQEGFASVVQAIMEKNQNFQVKLQSTVTHISYDENKKFYTVSYTEEKTGETLYQNFDLVVIAAPLEMAKIQFSKNLNVELSNRKTVPLHSYIIASDQINPRTIGLQEKEDVPKLVLSPDKIFGKISVLEKICDSCYDSQNQQQIQNLYYLRSRQEITKVEFQQLFNSDYQIHTYQYNEWPYPDLKDSRQKQLPKIQLKENLYYINGIEYLASCTELEVISAKNIVNIIKKQNRNWKKRQNQPNKKPSEEL